MTVCFQTMLDQLSTRAGDELLIEMHGRERRGENGAAILELIARFRTAIAGHGLEPGARVGLLAPNSIRWAAADLALLAEGLVVVPLYARQDPRELVGMMRDCGTALLLAATDELAGGVAEAWAKDQPDEGEAPAMPPVLLFDEAAGASPGDAEPRWAGADEPVTIIYTSGTSGEPKGVVYHRSHVEYMVPKTIDALVEMVGERPGGDVVFHYLPFCFAGSRIQLWTQLLRGSPLLMSTDLTNLIEEIGGADPHYFLNVPVLLERIRAGVRSSLEEKGGLGLRLYRAGLAAAKREREGRMAALDGLRLLFGRMVFAKIKQRIGPRLEFLICGSAPLSEDTQRWFETIGIPVLQVYGLTETTAIVTMDKPNRVRPGYVGPPIDGCEVKLDEDGQLLVKGPNIFAEYWGREAATAEAVVDGWFHTGDLAELDDEGRVRIVGRAKHVLVPESGHNVAPEPIEQALREHCPAIEQAMLFGHGRPWLGVLVTTEASDEDLTAALAALNSDLPHYRKIKRFLRTREPLTPENGALTANQKMRRSVIEQMYADEIGALYS